MQKHNKSKFVECPKAMLMGKLITLNTCIEKEKFSNQ